MAGTLTHLEMRTEVLDNLTQDASATTANGVSLSTMATRWLNRAQLRIARKHNLIWEEQTSATVHAQKSYNFDSNLRSVSTFRIEDGTNSRKLVCVMPTKFDQLYPKPDNEAEGLPTIYVPFENTNTFELFKIPDAAYVLRLRCSMWPTNLTGDSQYADYTFLDDVIIAYATMYGYQWLQEMNDAKFWRSVGDDELRSQLIAEVSKFPDWAPVSEGFTAQGASYIGEYWNDPFVTSSATGGSYLE